MIQPHLTTPCWLPLPETLLFRLAGFAALFTRPTWHNALWLLAGTVLAPGRRTVAAVLRILGRDRDDDFATFHRVLNRARWSSRLRARWSSRLAAGRLLRMLVASFVADDATVVIGLDDTIERRWGPKISARGIYRDPVRSSKGHFVKTSGLRWLSAMLLVPVPWAGRLLALPFLTVLAPSARFYANRPRAPKTLLDWARQVALQTSRWLPGRTIIFVADAAFSAIQFLADVRDHVSVVTRLRLDANLFAPPSPKRRGPGRRPIRGKPLPKLTDLLLDPNTPWLTYIVPVWYGETNRTVELTSGTALWYHGGLPPVPIRWLLVRDPLRKLKPQAFLCTDTNAAPTAILGWFIGRWQVEVTFEETRKHLGVETQRQWSDLAIMRTTPALLGLFSLVCLWTHDLHARQQLVPRTAAWYPKPQPTFSDAIAAVRRCIWRHHNAFMSPQAGDVVEIPRHLWNRMENALAYAA